MKPNNSKRSSKKDSGQGVVEYVLMITFVAVFLFFFMTWLGPQIRDLFSRQIDEDSTAKRESAVSSAIYEN